MKGLDEIRWNDQQKIREKFKGQHNDKIKASIVWAVKNVSHEGK